MNRSTPGLPVHHQLPELAQTHRIAQVSDAIQSSHPLRSPFPPAFNISEHQFFTSGGQSIGVSASASVLPMNIQDWYPLGLTGLISLQSEGLSRVFSNTTVQKHQFFGLSFIFQGLSCIIFLTIIINWQLVYTSHLLRSIRFSSVTQSCLTLWPHGLY